MQNKENWYSRTEILLDIAKRENVVFLKGNHDDMAMVVLQNLFNKKVKLDDKKLSKLIRQWYENGGEATLKQFLQCTRVERELALSVLEYAMIYEELEIEGRQYFLAHTIPEKKIINNFEKCKIEDFLWGEPEYDKVYCSEKIFITGHTPTGLIDRSHKGKIYKSNNHIAIDCGAAFGLPLGCIRLDDMKEFYV